MKKGGYKAPNSPPHYTSSFFKHASRTFGLIATINIQRGTKMAKTIPQLPETGFLRLPQIIGSRKADPPIPPIIPVSKSTWWEGVRNGRYPAPVRTLGPRITAWRAEDIRTLITALAKGTVQ